MIKRNEQDRCLPLQVKADPSSESTRRLQAAGAEVIRSTDNLVRAARNAISTEEERSLVLNRRMVGGIAQEIDARYRRTPHTPRPLLHTTHHLTGHSSRHNSLLSPRN